MASATDIIRAQHRDLAHVLKALEAIMDGPLEERRSADMAQLYDICHYVRVFPDKLHHPDEDRYVFGPLRAAAPEHAHLVDDIEGEHGRCQALTERLHGLIQAFDKGDATAGALRDAVRQYLSFQFDHMRKEERDLLPLVDELLDKKQRAAAAGAFSKHADPLFSANLRAGFEALRHRIESRA
jgi:branched-chain amino acid transport system ATP-binding protein